MPNSRPRPDTREREFAALLSGNAPREGVTLDADNVRETVSAHLRRARRVFASFLDVLPHTAGDVYRRARGVGPTIDQQERDQA